MLAKEDRTAIGSAAMAPRRTTGRDEKEQRARQCRRGRFMETTHRSLR